jgi:hypothetical protein
MDQNLNLSEIKFHYSFLVKINLNFKVFNKNHLKFYMKPIKIINYYFWLIIINIYNFFNKNLYLKYFKRKFNLLNCFLINIFQIFIYLLKESIMENTILVSNEQVNVYLKFSIQKYQNFYYCFHFN